MEEQRKKKGKRENQEMSGKKTGKKEKRVRKGRGDIEQG